MYGVRRMHKMASRTTVTVSLLLFLFTALVCGQKKMTYVNTGYGCRTRPFSVKCNSSCIKSGYTGGICIKIFCVCLPNWDDKDEKKLFQREYNERINFPEFGEKF